MRKFAMLLVASLLAHPASGAAPGLDGAWVVDLSAGPGKPCTQPMPLILHADGRVDGNFHGSTIEGGRWKQDRGRPCASFRTTDGVGPPDSAVCLDGATVRGQAWAEQRNVLSSWNATRAQA
jgi:hypothetical protein